MIFPLNWNWSRVSKFTLKSCARFYWQAPISDLFVCFCFSEILSSKKYTAKQKQYRLFAVVYHDGKEASIGHYITDVYHTGYLNWIRYDDSTVKRVSEKSVLHPHMPRVPYLLYYRRNDTFQTPTTTTTTTPTNNASTHNKWLDIWISVFVACDRRFIHVIGFALHFVIFSFSCENGISKFVFYFFNVSSGSWIVNYIRDLIKCLNYLFSAHPWFTKKRKKENNKTRKMKITDKCGHSVTEYRKLLCIACTIFLFFSGLISILFGSILILLNKTMWLRWPRNENFENWIYDTRWIRHTHNK